MILHFSKNERRDTTNTVGLSNGGFLLFAFGIVNLFKWVAFLYLAYKVPRNDCYSSKQSMLTNRTAVGKLFLTTMVILITMSTILDLLGPQTHSSVESFSLSVSRRVSQIVLGLCYHPFYISAVLSPTIFANGSAFQGKRGKRAHSTQAGASLEKLHLELRQIIRSLLQFSSFIMLSWYLRRSLSGFTGWGIFQMIYRMLPSPLSLFWALWGLRGRTP